MGRISSRAPCFWLGSPQAEEPLAVRHVRLGNTADERVRIQCHGHLLEVCENRRTLKPVHKSLLRSYGCASPVSLTTPRDPGEPGRFPLLTVILDLPLPGQLIATQFNDGSLQDTLIL